MPPSTQIPLATYLFTRLHQLGVRSIFGLPGDTNLPLLSQIPPSHLAWIGCANELNASYAADAYARLTGLSCLITTFGVGELSALNGIAGAYIERAAVVHVVGTPAREQQVEGKFVHHSVKAGDFEMFGRMEEGITCARVGLWDEETAGEQIDEVLGLCVVSSQPVYIAFPVDMVNVLVSSTNLDSPLHLPLPALVPQDDTILDEILERICAAKRPIILIDGESRAMGILSDLQRLVEKTQYPTWTTPFGKSLIDETLPNIHGIYRGKHDTPSTQQFIASTDLTLCFGHQPSGTNTYNFSALPDPETTIYFNHTTIQTRPNTTYSAPGQYIVNQLVRKLSSNSDSDQKAKYTAYLAPPSPPTILASFPPNNPIAHDFLWKALSPFLRPGDIILGDTGTSGHGVRELTLPSNTYLFTHSTWLCVGYGLPAAMGASIAQSDMNNKKQKEKEKGNGKGRGRETGRGRTILFIGDGGFQMTMQELGTIIRYRIPLTIFLLNNGGYTTERCLYGRKESYNDIPALQYLLAPKFFGAREGESWTARVGTWGELGGVLEDESCVDGEGLRMVEVMVGREDCPAGGLNAALRSQIEGEGKGEEVVRVKALL